MKKIKTNIVTKLLLCVMLLCTLCGALFLGASKEVSANAETTTVDYKDLLGLEDRTSWAAVDQPDVICLGTIITTGGYFNTDSGVNDCWYYGREDVIVANGGVDILQYIYVNDTSARALLTENNTSAAPQASTGTGSWLSNPAAWPIAVQPSADGGTWIRLSKAKFGESFTITFKVGFEITDVNNQRIVLSEDVNYKYENGALTKLEKEPVRVNYNNLLGLEDRAWGSNGDDHYLGGVTLEPFEWFNSADSVNGCWYNGNDAIIAANNGVDILQYIYVNGKQARQAITENQQLATPMVGTSGWLTNPAASPVYVETTNGSGIIIKLLKAWAGESYTFTFKAGFSLIRNDGAIIELTEDVNYKYENGALTKFVPAKECTITFEGTDVVKTVLSGEVIGELPEVPAKEGFVAVGWAINGEQITASTVVSASATATAVYKKELVKVNYNDQFGLEDRTSWGAHEGEYYFGGITLLDGDTEYFNTADSVSNTWYVGNDEIITANNGVDIMQYIYVNGQQAREAITANANGERLGNTCGCWLSNPAAYPVYVETTNGSGIIIRLAKAWAGESLTITFKAGFSLIRNDDVVIELTEDVEYKYANGSLSRLGNLCTLTFEGTEESKTLREGEAIGTLPAVPEREGAVGVWMIDSEILTDKAVYSYSTSKTAVVYYYEGTDISGTIDMMDWGSAVGADCTYLRIGNWTDENGNLFISTGFKNVHWQDHASTAAENYGCDIMEYIYINGKSARAISTQNGADRVYGGNETDTFPFNYGGVYAPIDVLTDNDEFRILVMNEYIEAEGLVVVLKAGFRMKTSDGGMLYLSEDFVFPYYKVSFGEELTVKVGYGQTVEAPSIVPTKEETESHTYTFDAWYNGETKWDFTTVVTENMTLTAVFTAVEKAKFAVAFDPANGDAATSVSVYVGSYVKAEQIPANPVKEGEESIAYTFLYWSLDGETEYDFATAVTEDITLTAVYTTKPVYQVTMGETVVNVVEGEKVVQPADPTKESTAEFDYTFEGWYNGETKWDFANDTVTEDLTLTAKYTETKRSYTITFNVTGYEGVSFDEVVLEYGETYDLSNLLDGIDLSKHTYAITSGGVAVTSITVISDVTVDVTFKAKIYYTVTINGVEYQIEVGEKLTQPEDPTKESTAEFDYTFDGWYNGNEKWNFDEDTVNGALNLIAKYKETKRKYTISFNIIGNDKLSLGSVEVEYGQIFDLSKVLEGVDVSGYTYSFTIGGLEKINFKVVEDVTVDVSFTQLVEDVKDKGKEGIEAAWDAVKDFFVGVGDKVEDGWNATKDYVSETADEMGCSSGIGSGVTGIALAAAVAFALKKKKED